MNQEKITEEIHRLVKESIKQRKEVFIPGKTSITSGEAVYDEAEINAIIDTLLKGWFGLSEKSTEFENQLSQYLTNKHTVMVNSGSSANLLALNSIKNKLELKGGEIITPACTFPTTLNPIIQLGFTPAFIDIDKTLNITPEGVKKALRENTRGIVFPHALGNPCRIDEIMEITKEKNLFVIEDCCDALGSEYGGKKCGSFGDASTLSFYPAHGITTGEGGAVSTKDSILNKTLRSLRDWGRACWCRSDEKNPNGACNRRFECSIGDIPYDHKYTYSQIGYNMKPLELQAAMGIEQMKKLEGFNKTRKRNFNVYQQELSAFEKHIELPEINEKAEPVFFGLPIIIKNPKIKRQELVRHLNENKIQTRFVFAGNALLQTAYKNIKHAKYQELEYTNKIARDCFWIGLHQGISEEMIKYTVSKLKEYFTRNH